MRGAGSADLVAAPAPSPRLDRLDALRGVAIVWMAGFHFCFDLEHYGLIREDFHRDPFWTVQRTCIVTLFLLCAGLGQAAALQPLDAAGAGMAQRYDRRFWRRWGQVAGCALLVSAGSALMFPQTWISFGVLHGIAAMLLLVRLVAGWGRGLWVLAAAALLLPRVVQHPWFDTRLTNWTGLVTQLPITEDYVPVLPWLGVMCVGVAAGRWLLVHRREWLAGALPRAVQPLAVLGRWSLSFYMLHQPVLIGALMAWLAWRGAAPAAR